MELNLNRIVISNGLTDDEYRDISFAILSLISSGKLTKDYHYVYMDKKTGVNDANSLNAFSNLVNLDSSKLVTINQIHSSKILIADSPGFYDPADGIINKGGNLVCSIKVADCLPVFFANNISKTIGLVHAGWRGLSLQGHAHICSARF